MFKTPPARAGDTPVDLEFAYTLSAQAKGRMLTVTLTAPLDLAQLVQDIAPSSSFCFARSGNGTCVPSRSAAFSDGPAVAALAPLPGPKIGQTAWVDPLALHPSLPHQQPASRLAHMPPPRVKVETLGKNIVGEIAILCDVPRTATVVAHCDLETLRLSKDAFFHLVTQFPQVGIEVMRELASRLHHTTQALTAARRDR